MLNILIEIKKESYAADKLMKYYAKIVDIPQKYFRTSFKRI